MAGEPVPKNTSSETLMAQQWRHLNMAPSEQVQRRFAIHGPIAALAHVSGANVSGAFQPCQYETSCNCRGSLFQFPVQDWHRERKLRTGCGSLIVENSLYAQNPAHLLFFLTS